MSAHPRVTRFYQFELRGFHALHLLGEPTHGHHCQLRVGVDPLDEKSEALFLGYVKEKIIKDFDRKNWAESLRGEPSGENVLLEIGRRLQAFEGAQVREVHLQETKKNLFSLGLSPGAKPPQTGGIRERARRSPVQK